MDLIIMVLLMILKEGYGNMQQAIMNSATLLQEDLSS